MLEGISQEIKEVIIEQNEHEVRTIEDKKINAYFLGKLDGFELYDRSKKELLSIKFDLMLNSCIKIINKLKTFDAKPISFYIKPLTYDVFRILFLVEEKDYCKEEFRSIFRFAHNEGKRNKKDFDIDYMFLENNSNLDLNRIGADGYLFRASCDKL